MQENHTILITCKHVKKITGYMMNISGDWKLINNRRPEVKTGF